MKRSEMLYHISEVVRINSGKARASEFADFLLKVMEEKGMLPPQTIYTEDREFYDDELERVVTRPCKLIKFAWDEE